MSLNPKDARAFWSKVDRDTLKRKKKETDGGARRRKQLSTVTFQRKKVGPSSSATTKTTNIASNTTTTTTTTTTNTTKSMVASSPKRHGKVSASSKPSPGSVKNLRTLFDANADSKRQGTPSLPKRGATAIDNDDDDGTHVKGVAGDDKKIPQERDGGDGHVVQSKSSKDEGVDCNRPIKGKEGDDRDDDIDDNDDDDVDDDNEDINDDDDDDAKDLVQEEDVVITRDRCDTQELNVLLSHLLPDPSSTVKQHSSPQDEYAVQSELERLRQALHEAQEGKRDYKEKVRLLKKQKTQTNAKLKNARKEISEAMEKNESLQRKLEQANARVEELEKQVTIHSKEDSILRERIIRLEKRVKRLKANASEASAEPSIGSTDSTSDTPCASRSSSHDQLPAASLDCPKEPLSSSALGKSTIPGDKVEAKRKQKAGQGAAKTGKHARSRSSFAHGKRRTRSTYHPRRKTKDTSHAGDDSAPTSNPYLPQHSHHGKTAMRLRNALHHGTRSPRSPSKPSSPTAGSSSSSLRDSGEQSPLKDPFPPTTARASPKSKSRSRGNFAPATISYQSKSPSKPARQKSKGSPSISRNRSPKVTRRNRKKDHTLRARARRGSSPTTPESLDDGEDSTHGRAGARNASATIDQTRSPKGTSSKGTEESSNTLSDAAHSPPPVAKQRRWKTQLRGGQRVTTTIFETPLEHLFGVLFFAKVDSTKPLEMPLFLENAFTLLEDSKSLQQSRLFTSNPSGTVVQHLSTLLGRDASFLKAMAPQPCVVGAFLVEFLKRLPEPLFTYPLFSQFSRIQCSMRPFPSSIEKVEEERHDELPDLPMRDRESMIMPRSLLLMPPLPARDRASIAVKSVGEERTAKPSATDGGVDSVDDEAFTVEQHMEEWNCEQAEMLHGVFTALPGPNRMVTTRLLALLDAHFQRHQEETDAIVGGDGHITSTAASALPSLERDAYRREVCALLGPILMKPPEVYGHDADMRSYLSEDALSLSLVDEGSKDGSARLLSRASHLRHFLHGPHSVGNDLMWESSDSSGRQRRLQAIHPRRVVGKLLDPNYALEDPAFAGIILLTHTYFVDSAVLLQRLLRSYYRYSHVVGARGGDDDDGGGMGHTSSNHSKARKHRSNGRKKAGKGTSSPSAMAMKQQHQRSEWDWALPYRLNILRLVTAWIKLHGASLVRHESFLQSLESFSTAMPPTLQPKESKTHDGVEMLGREKMKARHDRHQHQDDDDDDGDDDDRKRAEERADPGFPRKGGEEEEQWLLKALCTARSRLEARERARRRRWAVSKRLHTLPLPGEGDEVVRLIVNGKRGNGDDDDDDDEEEVQGVDDKDICGEGERSLGLGLDAKNEAVDEEKKRTRRKKKHLEEREKRSDKSRGKDTHVGGDESLPVIKIGEETHHRGASTNERTEDDTKTEKSPRKRKGSSGPPMADTSSRTMDADGEEKALLEAFPHRTPNPILQDIQKFAKGSLRKANTVDKSVPVLEAEIEDVFLSLDPRAVAEQLTLIAHALFDAVEVQELLHLNFQDGEKSPRLAACIDKFNQTARWVGTEVMRYRSHKIRARVITRFIRISKQLRILGNFQSFFAVMAGLTNSAVQRLHLSWDKVSKSALKTFHLLKSIVTPELNYRMYRQELKGLPPTSPCMPYLGVVISDLIMVEEYPLHISREKESPASCMSSDAKSRGEHQGEGVVEHGDSGGLKGEVEVDGNISHVEGEANEKLHDVDHHHCDDDTLLNLEKLRAIHHVVDEMYMQYLDRPLPKMEGDKALNAFLEELEVEDEDTLYAQSLKVEPRKG